MRYYTYVSAAKVEMLWAQIPASILQRILQRTETLKVPAVAEVNLGANVENLYTKLARCEEYIREELGVGTPSEPAAFFGGTVRMRMEVFRLRDRGKKLKGHKGGGIDWMVGSMVFWGGKAEGTIIALGGSVHHLVGQAPPRMAEKLIAAYGASQTGDILPILAEVLRQRQFSDEPSGASTDLSTVDSAVGALHGPEQRFEFLAKRLLMGHVDGRPVVLGSPLFVALAD